MQYTKEVNKILERILNKEKLKGIPQKFQKLLESFNIRNIFTVRMGKAFK